MGKKSHSGKTRKSYSKTPTKSYAKTTTATYTKKPSTSSNIKHKAGTYVIQNSVTKEKYIGRSSDIRKRVDQHNSGQGAKWTNIPVGKWNVVKTYAGNDNRTENAITKGVMRNEGIASVRGGSYCKEYYPQHEFRAIKKANGFTNY